MEFPYNPRTGASLVAIAAGVLLSVGCERDQSQAEWWQGERKIIGLSQQLKLKKYRHELVCTHDFESLERLRNTTETATSSLRVLRKQYLTLSHEVVSLEGEWDEFRRTTIQNQRHRTIGKSFEAIHLVSGRKFQEVTVFAIDDAGVTIRHADGSARLRFADLDSGQQVFFGLEKDLAVDAEEKEAEAAAVYERWIDDRMAIIHEQERKDSEIARREELALRQYRSQLAFQNAEIPKTRTLAQAATPFGSRSREYSDFYRPYRSRYRYFHYSTPGYIRNCQTDTSFRSSRATAIRSSSVFSASKCSTFANHPRRSIP